jgi:hypothetical protein
MDSRDAPEYLTPAGLAVLMYTLLGFTAFFVVGLLEMGYDLPTALQAAAVISVVAGEIAYRLLGRVDLSFPPGGGQPPAIA